ncbi:MAG: hydantoinase/oxoprolinase family protein [Alphaproteobacteria bacterium]|nr:hydantoinase/oxoprolinase family protein [Alphaproteobacteria bacterium]
MAKLAFDTGGTFTDFAFLGDDGRLLLHKVLSTPSDPAQAVVQGIGELLARVSPSPDSVQLQILGATTVVTNAVLERRGVDTAFVTTDGFQDMLRIRNEGRYDLYDLKIQYPEPLARREHSFGVRERITADGETALALDEGSVARIVERLRAANIGSVAVCLLHAYRFPRHEQAVGELLRKADQSLHVSLSSQVCPEVREFDRASTTVVNAYTQPLMARHVEHLEAQLGKRGIKRQLLWMTSSGGLVPSKSAAEAPVRLIESGPAAGAVAAAEYAALTGERSVLSFDMGGTTAKLCLVPDGKPMIGADLEVARHERFRRGSGFPLKIHSIQMIEIGAGGGSIAARNQLGLLDVGPRSAGAAPGPACYGLGGTEPTVTDADVLLGYVGAESFLGGGFRLDSGAARGAMARLAGELGVSAERCAWGIHDLVNEHMSEAAAMHVSDHGVDPRTLPLIAFGGAGPVHAYGVACKLGIEKVICPAGAGVTSAVGLLIAPVAADVSASHVMRLDRWDFATMRRILDDLAARGRPVVLGAGVRSGAIEHEYSIDMRHVGQGHEINIALPSLDLDDAAFRRQLRENFFKVYRDLFGRIVARSEIEAITWRLRVSGPKDAIVDSLAVAAAGDGREARKGSRPVFFDEVQDFVDTPVYDHHRLVPGVGIAGPAIVEQRESTVVVGPRATARLDARGNLIMQIS